MRLKPRSIFLGIVAFGLPMALTTGWTLGARQPFPAPVSERRAPAIGGIGSAPSGAVPAPLRSAPGWSPPAPRTVAEIITSTPPAVAVTSSRSAAPIQPTPTRTSAKPPFSPPPVPTPTPPSPDPAESSGDVSPPASASPAP